MTAALTFFVSPNQVIHPSDSTFSLCYDASHCVVVDRIILSTPHLLPSLSLVATTNIDNTTPSSSSSSSSSSIVHRPSSSSSSLPSSVPSLSSVAYLHLPHPRLDFLCISLSSHPSGSPLVFVIMLTPTRRRRHRSRNIVICELPTPSYRRHPGFIAVAVASRDSRRRQHNTFNIIIIIVITPAVFVAIHLCLQLQIHITYIQG
ncbi:predicted protein [Lichtheimia corymbifera JMRC:FSU:9682]|uniref:Uncharacterized protein n=1 Tax=Lichtheimia corymbifera JMRC:FSU:9682 TaxID=1263082 RepID=A0A068RZ74_9FUNG|nr:predicted protein [Lichtheimia corymbifera JMRC:FSU:9682]